MIVFAVLAVIGIAFFGWCIVRAGDRRPPSLSPLTPEQLQAFLRRLERGA